MAKKNFYERAMNMDRRIIYLVIGMLVLLPLLFPLNLPTGSSDPVMSVYNYLERISKEKENPAVMVCFNYSGATLPELQPMGRSILRHCFIRDIDVISYVWANPPGEGISENLLVELSQEYGKERGIDYVNFGYRVPVVPIMLGIGSNMHQVLPSDVHGTPVDSLIMMDDIRTYKDIDLVIELSGSASYRTWIVYARGKFGQDLAAGITGVMAAECYPFLQSGQLKGLLPGLKGGAEYEKLVDDLETMLKEEEGIDWVERRKKNLKKAIRAQYPDESPQKVQSIYEDRWEQSMSDVKKARVGMDSQAVAHIAIIIFVILGNIGYFMSDRKSRL